MQLLKQKQFKYLLLVILLVLATSVLFLFQNNLNKNIVSICNQEFTYTKTNEWVTSDDGNQSTFQGSFEDQWENIIIYVEKLHPERNRHDNSYDIEPIRLCIAVKNNDNQWQELYHEEHEALTINREFEIEIKDVNNDDKLDLIFPYQAGYSGVNISYNLLLNTDKDFVDIVEFRDIMNPIFTKDSIKKIESGYKAALNFGYIDYYTFENRELIIVERISEEITLDPTSGDTRLIRRYYEFDFDGNEVFIREEIKKID